MFKYFFILILPFSVFSQQNAEKAVVKTLCSFKYGGRGYVNSGDSLAAELIAKEFEVRGGAKVGDSFFQSFNFPVNTFPRKMELLQNQDALIPGVHFMVDPSSPGKLAKYGALDIPAKVLFSKEELELFLTAQVTEKTMIMAARLDIYSGDSLKRARQTFEVLAETFPTIEIYTKKFTWSVSSEQSKYLRLWIQDSVFKQNATFDIWIEAKLKQNHQARNVIAMIPAKKKARKAKTVFITAHYDHLGMMGEETHFPGANDNASGVGQLLSLCDYYKKNPGKYNMVFVAFAGEEIGLLGSKYYTENPMLPLKKIRFLLNLDIMGSGEAGITVVNGSVFTKEFDLLKVINTEKQLLTTINSRGKAANSDHYFFTEMGVPSFFFYTLGDNKHYHDIQDTFEELSFKEYQDLTTLVTEFVLKLK